MRTTDFLPVNRLRIVRTFLLIAALAFVAPSTRSLAAQGEAPPTAAALQETNTADLLRSNLQLQEQLHGLQLSIEESRKQAETAAARNAESVAGRLHTLEQTLAEERARDQKAVRDSKQVMLVVAATFGVVGLLAILLMAYQWRTVSRLAEVATGVPAGQLFGPGRALATVGGGDERLLGTGSADQSNARLLGAFEQLEKRIRELEQTEHPAPGQSVASGNHVDPAQLPPAGHSTVASAEPAASPTTSRIAMLVGKGQSLLSLDKPEEALACFDEVLALEPAHVDALIKKAAALERLRNLPEAINCYDRAIAADGSLTIAYLYKGGLFNRMERFAEALECYELALRAQDKRPG